MPRRSAPKRSAGSVVAAASWLQRNRQRLDRRGGTWVAIAGKTGVVARGRTLESTRARVVKQGYSGRVVLARVPKRPRAGVAA